MTTYRRGRLWRGNRYGIECSFTWPHVNLGVSAHLSSRFGHFTLHLPVGILILGCIGADNE